MGSLFSKLFTYLFGDKSIKIVIVGLDNAGKTTILYRLKLGKIVKTIPTTGFNLESVKYEGLNLDVWDLAGQKNSRLLWDLYLKETNCIMFVVDSTDRKRIDHVKYELDKLVANEGLTHVPFCILANKQDLEHKMSEKEIITLLELTEIKNRNWEIFKTSGKTGEGLDLAFKWISNQYQNVNPNSEDIRIIPHTEEEAEHKHKNSTDNDNNLLEEDIDTKIS